MAAPQHVDDLVDFLLTYQFESGTWHNPFPD